MSTLGNDSRSKFLGNYPVRPGVFTTISASGTVSGTGFSTYLASPPAIGGTTPAAITGTTITANTGLVGPHNGTVGASTPAAGNFTTLGSSSTTTLNGTTIPASKTLVVTTDIGTSVQGYSAATALTSATQTFTVPQRGTLTTDNDLSFDLAVTNYFVCTPSAGGVLTFTNIPAGQSGMILLVNGSNYAIAAHANTKVGTTTLATISATGTYLLSYFSDGTDVYVVNSGALA